MSSIARKRLAQEHAEWRRDPPHGFGARYAAASPESGLGYNPMKWICKLPGREGSHWEGGRFTLIMEFSEDYPSKPPKCRFDPVLFHPNIYPSGTVCLSILNEDEDWKPSITVRQILLGIQDLLDNPNPKSPAQLEPYLLFSNNMPAYVERVREQVKTLGS